MVSVDLLQVVVSLSSSWSLLVLAFPPVTAFTAADTEVCALSLALAFGFEEVGGVVVPAGPRSALDVGMMLK